jgi:hypothetical protein
MSVFIITCVVYALLAVFSYSDLIYCSELSTRTSFSAIETGQLSSSAGRDVLMLLFSAVLLYLYIQGFFLLKRNPPSRRVFFILAAALALIAFLVVPFDSTDASVYINCGWLQAHYHLNPYAVSVAEVPDWFHDPMFKEHWVGVPCNYGPVFAAFCQAVALLGGGNYIVTLFILKAANVFCHLSVAGMILFAISSLQTRDQSIESAYLYAFSPFMLLHEIANGHNDILMSFFTCLAAVLWLYRRYLLVFLTFLTGVAIKYLSLVMLPGLLYLMVRRAGARKTIVGLLLGIIPQGVLCYLYFSPMDQSHRDALLALANSGQGSLRSVIAMWQQPVLDRIFALLIGAACLLICLRHVYRWLRLPDHDQLARRVLSDTVLFLILLVCFYNVSFRAWYPAAFFPLAMFLPPGSRTRRFSIVLTCLLISSISWFGFPDRILTPLFVFLAFVASKASRDNISAEG